PLLEHRLAAAGRHTDRIAISGNPADDTLGDPPAAGVVKGTESQWVHHRDRSGPHGENVANDPADTGRRSLIGLDRRRVVMAFDPQCDRDPITGIDDAGAFAWSNQDVSTFARQPSEVKP